MKQWHLFCLLPLMAACDSGHSGSGELISVDLRQGIDHPSMLNLQDEVESVEYIPLETTDDPASLLDGVSEYALTSKYIYVSPVKEQRIVQFDRKGHFIKTLIPFGQGPGEFSVFLERKIQLSTKKWTCEFTIGNNKAMSDTEEKVNILSHIK